MAESLESIWLLSEKLNGQLAEVVEHGACQEDDVQFNLVGEAPRWAEKWIVYVFSVFLHNCLSYDQLVIMIQSESIKDGLEHVLGFLAQWLSEVVQEEQLCCN